MTCRRFLQVEALTHELTDLQQRAVDRATLAAAEAGRAEAEARAAALERERGSIAAEVEEMQAALARLQQEAGAETQARVRCGAGCASAGKGRERRAVHAKAALERGGDGFERPCHALCSTVAARQCFTHFLCEVLTALAVLWPPPCSAAFGEAEGHPGGGPGSEGAAGGTAHGRRDQGGGPAGAAGTERGGQRGAGCCTIWRQQSGAAQLDALAVRWPWR